MENKNLQEVAMILNPGGDNDLNTGGTGGGSGSSGDGDTKNIN